MRAAERQPGSLNCAAGLMCWLREARERTRKGLAMAVACAVKICGAAGIRLVSAALADSADDELAFLNDESAQRN